MKHTLPVYENWVLAYITSYRPDTNYVTGYVLELSQYLADRNYHNAGAEIGSDVDVTPETRLKVGLAYFKMTMVDEDDVPMLSEPAWLWTPPR